MYFGHISNVVPNRYPRAIQEALDYIKNTDFDKLEAGRYALKGDLVYVQVLDLQTKPKAELLPEVHRKYLDVQYLHAGKERMGVAIDQGNNKVAQEYCTERDILYYESVTDENDLVCRPGNFAVFFPEDIHRAGCDDGESSPIRKIVVKIAVSELDC